MARRRIGANQKHSASGVRYYDYGRILWDIFTTVPMNCVPLPPLGGGVAMDTHEELLKLLEKQRAIENEIGVSLLSRPICQTVSARWLLTGDAKRGADDVAGSRERSLYLQQRLNSRSEHSTADGPRTAGVTALSNPPTPQGPDISTAVGTGDASRGLGVPDPQEQRKEQMEGNEGEIQGRLSQAKEEVDYDQEGQEEGHLRWQRCHFTSRCQFGCTPC